MILEIKKLRGNVDQLENTILFLAGSDGARWLKDHGYRATGSPDTKSSRQKRSEK